MAGISEAGHRWFMARMREQASAEQRRLVKEELKQLRRLYADYHSGLAELHRLADAYRVTLRDIRLKLRRQQRERRQGGPGDH
jgi:hypothetical protein